MSDKNKVVSSLADVTLIDFQHISDNRGELYVMEEKTNLPIPLRRIFLVTGPLGVKRGEHAHRVCNQILVCITGRCRVICQDGVSSNEVVLDNPKKGLHIPPGIWAEQIYEDENTSLMVLCDQVYDEADYIRDYNEFNTYREAVKIL